MKVSEWFFEDYVVGERIRTMGRTITEADLGQFVGLAGFYEEGFINARWAEERSVFKGRVIPGMLTLSLAEGLLTLTGVLRNGIALLGLTDLRLTAPVLCGDTLWETAEVKSARPASDGNRGVVQLEHTVSTDARGEVMSYLTTRLVRCEEGADDVEDRNP